MTWEEYETTFTHPKMKYVEPTEEETLSAINFANEQKQQRIIGANAPINQETKQDLKRLKLQLPALWESLGYSEQEPLGLDFSCG